MSDGKRLGDSPIQFAVRLAKALGVEPGVKCDNRKGILQIRTPDGDWTTIMYNDGVDGDNPPKEAKVLPCSHIGLDAALFYMRQVIEEVMNNGGKKEVNGEAKNIFIPKPEDFRFLHIDEEPPEVEVSNTDDAEAALAKFTSKAQS